MRFIQEFGYTVKIGQDEAHQRWFEENDAALRGAMPAGSKYIGTFAVVISSEKQAGSYRTLFELESYATMDGLAAASKDPNNEFGRLLRESSKFLDTDLAAPWSSAILKDILDATVWNPQES